MKKITRLLFATVASLVMAVSFTGCAGLLDALGGALFGKNQTLKVTSTDSKLDGKNIYFYVVEMVQEDGQYVPGENKFAYNQVVNSAAVKVSDKFETLKYYKIYVSGDGYSYDYGNRALEDRPIVKLSSTDASSVTIVGTSNDIFGIAGDIDYEIVLKVVNSDIVAEMKGTRQAKE